MRDNDVSSESTALSMLREQLNDPSLKSSARVLILVSLALNRKMTFMDLLTLTGTGKGSLSNHLEKLESAGFITIRTKATFSRDRRIIEITEKGLIAYKTLVRTMNALQEEDDRYRDAY
jgi:DNA-binding MarR family transcriptional regulator